MSVYLPDIGSIRSCQFHIKLINSSPIPNLSIPIPFFPTLFLPNTFYHELVLRVPTCNTYSE